MKPRADRLCNETSREHYDANEIVLALIAANGSLTLTQDELAGRLGFWVTLGGGIRQIDNSRFHRARNHIRDRIDGDGRPCCGYTVHYRRSGRQSTLALIDPSGDLGSHAAAARATLAGYISRKRQHATEDQRIIETCELLGDHCLARDDKIGYRLMQRSTIEIERDGQISPATMADISAWLTTLGNGA